MITLLSLTGAFYTDPLGSDSSASTRTASATPEGGGDENNDAAGGDESADDGAGEDDQGDENLDTQDETDIPEDGTSAGTTQLVPSETTSTPTAAPSPEVTPEPTPPTTTLAPQSLVRNREVCGDGIDNDEDGQSDSADFDCIQVQPMTRQINPLLTFELQPTATPTPTPTPGESRILTPRPFANICQNFPDLCPSPNLGEGAGEELEQPGQEDEGAEGAGEELEQPGQGEERERSEEEIGTETQPPPILQSPPPTIAITLPPTSELTESPPVTPVESPEPTPSLVNICQNFPELCPVTALPTPLPTIPEDGGEEGSESPTDIGQGGGEELEEGSEERTDTPPTPGELQILTRQPLPFTQDLLERVTPTPTPLPTPEGPVVK